MKLRQNKLVPLVLEERPGAVADAPGRSAADSHLRSLMPRLEAIRQSWICNDQQIDVKRYCLNLPEDLLQEYSRYRSESRLGDIFTLANHFQAHTDRVVFIGSAQAQSVVHTFLNACCDPYWNELHRGERGSKPRVYCIGDSLDNDTYQGLLHLFSPLRPSNRQEPLGWGAIALEPRSHAPGQLFVRDHIEQYLRSSGLEAFFLQSPIRSPLQSQRSSTIESSFLAFSEIGMLPAAILGINIMELLSGAAFASRLFVSTPANENPILRWVAWKLSAPTRNLSVWNQSLMAATKWLNHLGASRRGDAIATDIRWNVVTPLSHRLADHELLSCNHLWVDQPRFDPLALAPSPIDKIQWDPSSERPRPMQPFSNDGPTCMDDAKTRYEQTLEQQVSQGGAGLTIRFEDLRELSLGQWMQWMIIARLLEEALEDT